LRFFVLSPTNVGLSTPHPKRNVLPALLWVMTLSLIAPHSFASSTKQATIAIVIDDLGHHYKRGMALIESPHPLTLSFLPSRQHTRTLAKYAYLSGKEVMLHAPMENSRQFELGAGALTSAMSKAQIQNSLRDSLTKVPHLKGLNNHMGSLLTTNPVVMNWVMEVVAKHPYYFLDSKTSSQSVAAKTALRFGIPTLERDIFLDHEQNTSFISKQFSRLLSIAKEKGTAIAIAHPHPETIQFLEQALPAIGEQGISIATLSALWRIRNPEHSMFATKSVRVAERHLEDEINTSESPSTKL